MLYGGRAMATTTPDLVTVQTRLDPDVHRRLERKSAEGERSIAAEMRLAIQAWVAGDREPVTTTAEVA
jgi:plasmid stability protein